MASKVSAWMIPVIGERLPLCTVADVRAIAPVAGSPPKRGQTRFSTPCTIYSVLLSCRSPASPSATTAESKDSIAPSSALAVAGLIGSRSKSKLISGKRRAGNDEGIALLPKREPIVATPCDSLQRFKITETIAPTIARMETGNQRKPTRGHHQITARETIARPRANGGKPDRLFHSQGSFSKNSRGTGVVG